MSDYVGLLFRASKVTNSTIKEISCSSNSNRRKPKKTSFQIQQVINEIGKMLSAGKPDREIMEQLQIKRSQYYEYKSKLFQQSAELFDRFNDENRDSLIYQKETLSERLIRLYKQAESDLTQNTLLKVVTIELLSILRPRTSAINIFKLESEGLRILANGQGRQLRALQAYNEKRGIPTALHMREQKLSTIMSLRFTKYCYFP